MAMVKICGATTRGDIELLSATGADLVGLWYGIAGGPHDLSVREVSTLAAVSRIGGRLQPVLVTFLNDAEVLLNVASRTGVHWVQLHGYQPPATVRVLKEARTVGLTVVKVLHVKGESCVERPLIPAYERAGVDMFILDATTEDGRVGSTAQELDAAVVLDLADRFTKPFLLAGGISAENRLAFQSVVEHPHFVGVDVDTGARDHQGWFDQGQVSAITQAWQVTRREWAAA